MIQIQVIEPPGLNISEKRQKDIEKYYGRQDFRRAFYSEFGEIHFPDRAMETYLRGLLARLGRGAHPEPRLPAGHRLLVLAGRRYSLPNILGRPRCRGLALRAFTSSSRPTMAR